MLQYFTDPVLSAPTIGSMLMCMAASLVGVLVFARKRSLLGETLSHAAYPGVILAIVIVSSWLNNSEEVLLLAVLIGAFISSLLGLFAIDLLQKRFKVSSDSALCLILSTFFGFGITMASRVQMIFPQEYKQMQTYLFGQAATMTDIHIVIYGFLSLLVLACIFLFYKEIKTMSFDVNYAKSIGLPTKLVETVTYALIVLAIVVGIRSVGVVLMSAMLIAPAVAARQYTNKLKNIFVLAACFGIISGFLGNYLSFEFSSQLNGQKLSFPTGPMIVLVAAAIAVFSLLFAPNRGVVIRMLRIVLFRMHCMQENILKALWRFDQEKEVSLKLIRKHQSASQFYLKLVLVRLCKRGWVIENQGGYYQLTSEGKKRAAHIVRLHRLWEVYLSSYLGAPKERVHRSAEEMEHIITKELEEELTKLLHDPKVDPHHQPIPPGGNLS